MLAILALIVFIVAGILKLVGKHGDWLLWMVILGGILISAHGIWGWAGPRYWNRTRQAP